MHHRFPLILACVLLAAPPSFGTPAAAQDGLAKAATWHSPTYAEVRAQVFEWLGGAELDEAQRAQAKALWPEEEAGAGEVAILDRLAKTIAEVVPGAAPLVTQCQQPRPRTGLPSFEVLADESQPPLVRTNL